MRIWVVQPVAGEKKPLPSLPWPLGHVRLISLLGLVCAALLCFSSLPVSLLFPALRGLSQKKHSR